MKKDTMFFFTNFEIDNKASSTGFRMSCVEGYYHQEDNSIIEVYLTSGKVLKISSHYSDAFYNAMDSFFFRTDLIEFQEEECTDKKADNETDNTIPF